MYEDNNLEDNNRFITVIWTERELVITKDYQIKISDLATSGLFPVVSQSTKNFIDGYISTSKEKLLNPKLLPIIVFGDHTRVTKYIDFPFIVGADGVKLLHPKIPSDTKFLYYIIKNLASNLRSRGYNRHFPLLKK